jgi:hypothetical protein
LKIAPNFSPDERKCGKFILTWNSGMIKLVDWHWLLDFVVCRENNFNRFSLPINPYFKNVMWLEK